jgi:DNA-binding winged helix-turn-helix (wHTH) protein/Flp pilus assembly protein TadD
MSPAATLLEFGPFRLDGARRLLWRSDQLVPVTPKALELLQTLVDQQGQVVTKHELMARIWPDSFVEEANLSVYVSALRKALGRQADGRPWIETLSRRGYRFVGKARPAASTLRSLAVLPFRSLDGKGGDETFGLGMADALITRLGHLGQIVVCPTSAVVKLAGRDPRQAGLDLRVDAVLDGRIQRADNRVRATVQLLGVTDGGALWADTFDEAFTQIFDVQDAIAERVAHSLTLRLSDTDRGRLIQRPTASVEAYEAYLRGRYFWNKLTGPWLEKAREAFAEAIARDPDFALAQAGLADSCIMLGVYGLLPAREAFSRARSSAEKAVEADPALAEAHVSLAYARLFGEWAWAEARRALARALALNPASATVRGWHALFLGMTGDLPGAFEEVRRAQELDPLSLTVRTNAGFQFYLAHQYESEIGQHRRTLELEPDYAVGHWALALAYEQKGMLEEAIAEHRKSVALSGGSVLMKANLARAFGLAGRKREAREVLRELEAAAVSPYRIATVHLALGDVPTTFAWLQRASRERDHWMVWLKVDPMFEPLRGDRRFPALLRKVGFPR